MSERIKSYILIFSTLAVGFVMGFLFNGYWVQQKVRSMHQRNTSGGFMYFLETELALTETQREAIQPILDQHLPAMRQHFQELRKRREEGMQNMRTAIYPILDSEQKSKLEAHFQRMERARKHFQHRGKMPKGPPPR
ncbi:MAG: periplasmic heavy metal sensor [Bacteroidota bacterium]